MWQARKLCVKSFIAGHTATLLATPEWSHVKEEGADVYISLNMSPSDQGCMVTARDSS